MALTEGQNIGTGNADAAQPTSLWNSPCGWLENGEHILPMRVYYEDTDAAGIVYYANYLKFAERARTEMIRCLGLEHGQLLAETGVVFAVRACTVEYLQPARLDDEIAVCTRIDSVRGASLGVTQRVVRSDGGGRSVALAELNVRLACINQAQRPARMPAKIRGAVATLMAS